MIFCKNVFPDEELIAIQNATERKLQKVLFSGENYLKMDC